MKIKQLTKTADVTLLAECLWEVLTWIERNATDTTSDIVELHDYVKPRLDWVLREKRITKEVTWPDDDSDEAATSNSDGQLQLPSVTQSPTMKK